MADNFQNDQYFDHTVKILYACEMVQKVHHGTFLYFNLTELCF